MGCLSGSPLGIHELVRMCSPHSGYVRRCRALSLHIRQDCDLSAWHGDCFDWWSVDVVGDANTGHNRSHRAQITRAQITRAQITPGPDYAGPDYEETEMKILMVTNTFTPHVGGVARSVSAFSEKFRQLGHQVLVVCPTYEHTESTKDVLRLPAIEHFRHSDFSFPLPIPTGVHRRIDEFAPDIVHAHHPFLLGDTALRVGAERGIPVVFTHHTQYDKYAHHFKRGDSKLTQTFINVLDVGYCNLCDAVVAPSQTVAEDLGARDVTTRIEVIPTGIDVAFWNEQVTPSARQEYGIPTDAFVVGHVGRLAGEKNIPFLAQSVARFLADRPKAWFVVAGVGPCEADILMACEKHQVSDRLLIYGIMSLAELRRLYQSFDVFAFASKSETQGIVLAEAMAAGVPVVGIDAPGVREIVSDRINGRLLHQENTAAYVEALGWIADLDPANRAVMNQELAETVKRYSIDHCTDQMLDLYDWSIKLQRVSDPAELHAWRTSIRRVEEELKIWGNFAHAIADTMVSSVSGKVFG